MLSGGTQHQTKCPNIPEEKDEPDESAKAVKKPLWTPVRKTLTVQQQQNRIRPIKIWLELSAIKYEV